MLSAAVCLKAWGTQKSLGMMHLWPQWRNNKKTSQNKKKIIIVTIIIKPRRVLDKSKQKSKGLLNIIESNIYMHIYMKEKSRVLQLNNENSMGKVKEQNNQ